MPLKIVMITLITKGTAIWSYTATVTVLEHKRDAGSEDLRVAESWW